MARSVCVFDPTAKDKLSQVRGIGRYLQILKEAFANEWIFADELKRIPADSVFINPFFNFFRPPVLMRKIAKKQIAVIHDLIPLKYPENFPAGIRGNINIYLNKLALKNYDVIITDSQTSKKDIVQILGLQENKIKVIYPCLPKVFTNPKSEIRGSKQILNSNLKNSKQKQNIMDLGFRNWNLFGTSDLGFGALNYCLYVGDATWNKNLVNLARALKIINVTCIFVGKVFQKINPKSEIRGSKQILNSNLKNSKQKQNIMDLGFRNWNLFGTSDLGFGASALNHPWQKEFRNFLSEVSDDKRFIFLGYIDDYKLIKLYQQARVNILISRAEGFGFSFLEAASQACPSILSDISVFHEIAADSAWFADPKNPHDIADKIGEIYFNYNLRNKLGGKAEKRVKYFSREKFKRKFLGTVNQK